MIPHLEAITARLADVVEVDELSEADLWSNHGPLLWRARRFSGRPGFYPVYRSGELYSYSPLALILAKGRIAYDAELARQCSARSFRYLSGRGVLDREIERLGGPVASTGEVVSGRVYTERIVDALTRDVAAAEARHPDHTNIILCGGKDSLNLLLLPWSNPTYAASAPPNFELVERFVRDNRLSLNVVRLDDLSDAEILDAEVLENGCRNNLIHCRWGVDLHRLARKHEGKVIFWKGQLGDLTMTPKWKETAHPPHALNRTSRKVYTRLERVLPAGARRQIGRRYLEPRFREILWQRSAMWQGAHVSLVRAITDCLVLSAYHGPAMARTFAEVDLDAAVQTDLRDDVGARLLGGPVVYPTSNPGPPPSRLRANRSSPERFLSMLEAAGIQIGR